mmetsp:Transcript_34870/g.42635  ORF Transcript_34870/g.42635 Transcript_34870/m.42635 type:complete len:208 (-) Transcript_34870:296-919(-)
MRHGHHSFHSHANIIPSTLVRFESQVPLAVRDLERTDKFGIARYVLPINHLLYRNVVGRSAVFLARQTRDFVFRPTASRCLDDGGGGGSFGGDGGICVFFVVACRRSQMSFLGVGGTVTANDIVVVISLLWFLLLLLLRSSSRRRRRLDAFVVFVPFVTLVARYFLVFGTFYSMERFFGIQDRMRTVLSYITVHALFVYAFVVDKAH